MIRPSGFGLWCLLLIMPLCGANSGASGLLRAPHAPPAIVAIHFSDHSFASGDYVNASVITTSNVASVEARVAAYGYSLRRTSVGHFVLHYQVPPVPFFFHRSWPVSVIARNVDGIESTKTVTISLH